MGSYMCFECFWHFFSVLAVFVLLNHGFLLWGKEERSEEYLINTSRKKQDTLHPAGM